MATPTVSVSDVVVSESDGFALFVVTLSEASASTVSVTYQADNGTAVGNGSDFVYTGVQALSFAAGETVKTVRVALTDDTTAEGTEGFYLHLLSVTNGVLGQSQGTATIVDNDAAKGMPTISVNDVVVDEKAGRAYVTLTLDKPSASAVSVTVATVNGSAVAGADYQAVTSQKVGFAPGETSKTVAIALIDDTAAESGESFNLLLGNVSGATLADDRAVVGIAASDAASSTTPTVSIGDVVTNERLGYAEFVLTLSAPSAQTVSLTYQADNGTAVGNGSDFAYTGVQTLSFGAGETVKTVRVALTDDTTAEGTEGFYLHLLSVTNGVLGQSRGTATIVDDDRSTAVPQVRVGDVVNFEDAGEIVFTVTLDRPNASAVTVNATLVPDTAQPGDDYAPATLAPITFAPGETMHEVHVGLVNDTTAEEVESFGLNVTLAPGSAGNIADGQAVGTILDDDGPAPSGVPTWTDFAQLAQLAYRPGSWEQVAGYPYVSSDDLARQPFFDNLLSTLEAQGWTPLAANDLFSAATSAHYTNGNQQFEDGLFTNQNAAAVVLRHGNALVIGFRGTNDTIDLLQDVGVGGFVDHYQLLQPLVAAVDAYRTAHPEITQVYVTGHSLGGAMAEWYMATHGAANTWAVTFAAPGIDARDGFDGRRDGRILNFEVDGDPVPDLLPHRGYTLHYDTTLVYDNPIDYHAMDLYRSLTEYAVREGLSASVVADRFAHAGDDELAVYARCFEDAQGVHVGTGNDIGWRWYELPGLSYIVLGGPGADDLYGTDHTGLLGGTVAKDDLMYGGTGNDTLRGLEGNDVLRGGSGADRLDGGVGNDTMIGGSGNDSYVVDSSAEVVTETGAAATEVDTVTTSVSWTLGANFENLTLAGTATIGRGNGLANVLTGNASNNLLSAGGGDDILRGSVGNDTLIGGAGSDSLVGGSGADRLQLNSVVGSDTATGFLSATDTIAVSMASLRIGDGDTLVEGALVRGAPGGFARTAELVVFTANLATLDATAAAAAIGSAGSAYAVGDSALFVVDDGSSSALYLFRAANANALVSASELTLLATLSGTPATAVADYVFVA